MRAWTIVLFILAIHACLAMMTVANVTNGGLNLTINTQTKNANIQVSEGQHSNLSLPVDPTFFSTDPNATNNSIRSSGAILISRNDFVQNFITSIFDAGGMFFKFMGTFSSAIFSIHELCKPYFGDYNSWILEAIVDTVFGVSLFQLVTGRSFKTME